jgi:small-conductance mechanosensitive channel
MKGRNLEGAPIEKRDTLEELIKQARELGGLEHQKLVVSEHIREIIRQSTTSRSEPELHNTLVHSLSTLNAQISTLQDQIEVTKASVLAQSTA